jgi:hypothetical protein
LTVHEWYAHKNNHGFCDIESHILSTRAYGKPTDPVYKVRITERPDKPLPADSKQEQHIGWLDQKGELCLVQQCLMLFGMQFPYGFRAEEQRDRGKAICLDVELIEEL